MKYLGIIAFIFISSSALAQTIKVSKVDNADLIKFANSSKLIAETDAAQNLRIKVFLLHNDPGSAGYEMVK